MSSPIAWSDVISLPGAVNDFPNVPVGGQTMILAVVNSVTNFDPNGCDGEDGPITKLARCYLAAHLAALGVLGMGGPLIAEADGRLSRQYAMPETRSSFFTTSYGRAFFTLLGPQVHGPRLL